MKTKKTTLAMKRAASTGAGMKYPSQAPAMATGGGVKIRGTGAATKGLMARGPMG